jgi:hypothetical protein
MADYNPETLVDPREYFSPPKKMNPDGVQARIFARINKIDPNPDPISIEAARRCIEYVSDPRVFYPRSNS